MDVTDGAYAPTYTPVPKAGRVLLRPSLEEAPCRVPSGFSWSTTTRCCGHLWPSSSRPKATTSPSKPAPAPTAAALARDGLYEFMILDVGIARLRRPHALPQVREDGVTCPIVLLTAKDSDADMIEGLQSGANDYVSKPFRFRRADGAHPCASEKPRARRRCRLPHQATTPSAPAPNCCSTPTGKKIRLTEKETNILKFLYRSGDTVRRDTLLHEVWGYNPAVTTAHARDPHLSPAPEDRREPGPGADIRDRRRRVPSGGVRTKAVMGRA